MTDLLNDFINEIATDSVNAKLEYVCVDCGGKGWVEIHVCRDDEECKKRCPIKEHCMACLGTGVI